MKNFLLIAGAAVAYYLFTQQKAISLLNYVINGVSLGFTNLSPVLRLTIGIQNPSNESFTINAFNGNLSANGQDLGTASNFTKIDVPPVSQINYPIDIKLNVLGITEDIVNLITTQSGISQTIELKGMVNANGIVAPIDLSYKIAF